MWSGLFQVEEQRMEVFRWYKGWRTKRVQQARHHPKELFGATEAFSKGPPAAKLKRGTRGQG